jgi:hypothetical protein
MRRAALRIAVVLLAFGVPAAAGAQQILIDRGVQVADLWCFPAVEAPGQWYYLPQRARLAEHERGGPVFSFLRYAINRPSEAGDGRGVVEAEGGGIVTLMATYDTPANVVRRAERELQAMTENPEAVLRGPVIFKEGRYVLVSSILREDGEEEQQALAAGNAPVFEGNEVAFSFDVDPQRSKLLLESFKMPTPDVSIVFEMTVTGLTDAYDAVIHVDWEEVKKNEHFEADFQYGGIIPLVTADIEQDLEELTNREAVRIEVRGENPNMQKLLDKAHQKVIDMLYTRLSPEQEQEVAPQQQAQGGGLLGGIVGGITGMLALTKLLSPASATATYHAKKIERSGTTRIQLNHQTPTDRFVTMAANIGNLYQRYGDDSNVFRTVNLADPAYQQREVHVGIDGAILT